MPKPANPPLSVTVLSASSEQRQKRKPGRPSSLEMPPLPAEILDNMSENEREHFDYFRSAYEAAAIRKYGRLTPTAEINILQAALDYIHLLRLQAEQIKSGTLVSQARQHPGVQLRSWLAACGLCDKDLEEKKEEKKEDGMKEFLMSLSS